MRKWNESYFLVEALATLPSSLPAKSNEEVPEEQRINIHITVQGLLKLWQPRFNGAL